MRTNPPCYRCTSLTPLVTGQIGLCAKCADEVHDVAYRSSTAQLCPRCMWTFFNDWERIQHLVNDRHGYRSWTVEDGRRSFEANGRA